MKLYTPSEPRVRRVSRFELQTPSIPSGPLVRRVSKFELQTIFPNHLSNRVSSVLSVSV